MIVVEGKSDNREEETTKKEEKPNLSRREFLVIYLSFDSEMSYHRHKEERKEILRRHQLTENQAVEITRKFDIFDFSNNLEEEDKGTSKEADHGDL